jgi:hypothetical protein
MKNFSVVGGDERETKNISSVGGCENQICYKDK